MVRPVRSFRVRWAFWRMYSGALSRGSPWLSKKLQSRSMVGTSLKGFT